MQLEKKKTIGQLRILLDLGKMEINKMEGVPGLMVLPVYWLVIERKISFKVLMGGRLVEWLIM